jgi:hypothetical protein
MSLSSLREKEPISRGRKRIGVDKGNLELSFWDRAYPIGYSGAWSPSLDCLQVSALCRGILLNLRHFAERGVGLQSGATEGARIAWMSGLKSEYGTHTRENKRRLNPGRPE